MSALHQHYRLLLGLDETWDVADVQFDLKANRVSIALAQWPGVRVACPECNASCSVYDHANERTWRHLDTMQFETRLTARLPRSHCAKCGVKLCAAPWAEPHSRFTLLFEALAIIKVAKRFKKYRPRIRQLLPPADHLCHERRLQ